jgi:hypothetical protein
MRKSVIGFRKFDAGICGNHSIANPTSATGKLQIDFAVKALEENHGRRTLDDPPILKENTMRKNVIRMMLAMVLLVTGSAMQAHAATLPAPTPTLPPVSCN